MDSIRPLPSVQPVNQPSAKDQGSSGNQAQFDKGQIFKALVAEAKQDGNFLLDIAGTKVKAHSTALLNKGDILQLQVIRSSPNVELQIVRDSPLQFIGRTLTLVDSSFDLSTLIHVLKGSSPAPFTQLPSVTQGVLENFFRLQQQPFEQNQSGEMLRDLIENLGLKMEAQLANGDKAGALSSVKAALLEIVHLFGKGQEIAQTTHRLLTSLEFFQLSQVHISGEHIIIPLPLPFLEQGFLVYDQKDDQSKDGQRREHHLSLHLKISGLGNLQVDILHMQENLFIRFRAEDAEKVEYLSAFAQQLQNNLSIPAKISFGTGASDPMQDLATRLFLTDGSSLDTTV